MKTVKEKFLQVLATLVAAFVLGVNLLAPTTAFAAGVGTSEVGYVQIEAFTQTATRQITRDFAANQSIPGFINYNSGGWTGRLDHVSTQHLANGVRRATFRGTVRRPSPPVAECIYVGGGLHMCPAYAPIEELED